MRWFRVTGHSTESGDGGHGGDVGIVTVRLIVLLGLSALLLSGCQTPGSDRHDPARSTTAAEPGDGPPLVIPPDLAHLPDPVVISEPRSKRGNPETYTVFGKTYRVMDSEVGYYATGLASWYGKKFHGRPTSSGEPFDMFKLTAAHPSLPIPTFARVTNLDNGRSTVVRINDRGPFHANRLIDLSYAAAVKLGYAEEGTARVRVEVLTAAKDFFLQAGAFRDLNSADRLKAELEALTGQPSFVVRVADDALYRVRVGPVAGRQEAERLRGLIVAARHPEPLILPN